MIYGNRDKALKVSKAIKKGKFKKAGRLLKKNPNPRTEAFLRREKEKARKKSKKT
jgi:hypothetical protein